MQVYICEICGDAYIGKDKPTECPFCGAEANYIKKGDVAQPVLEREEKLSEETKKMMEETYDLEVRAVAIYTCMAEQAKSYEIRAMYKRLAKIELEHASIANKFLGKGRPQIEEKSCSDDEVENFKATIELEDHATELYLNFSKKAGEEKAKIFFVALSQIEAGHTKLIENYLE